MNRDTAVLFFILYYKAIFLVNNFKQKLKFLYGSCVNLIKKE